MDSASLRRAEGSLKFFVDVGPHGRVSAAIARAADPIEVTLILAHGAGAPRTHPFMKDMAARLAKRGIDVVTFNFLYTESGRKMPDRVELLEATFRAAVATVRARGGLHTERLFIGGKSMGGRIATHVADRSVSGVVLLGYPLHPPGKKTLRDDIKNVRVPVLVVQGTRDAFGTAAELKKYIGSMSRARVHAVEGGDHSLVVPRSLGPEKQEQALAGAADAIKKFVGK